VPKSDIETRFQEIAARLDYPMFIVTTAHGEERAGCLVGFAAQCSISPPRMAVFLSNKNYTYRVARDAVALAVHIVPSDRKDLAELFGSQTGDDIDKFAACEWTAGPHGVPLLDGCGDVIVGAVKDRADVGDHAAYIVEVTDVRGEGGAFLSFQQSKDLEPGHDA
jgi:flavin reductase (DIM6/NTAB) family NADH-FMN oxidoreductase RutF